MTICIVGINAFQGYWLWTTWQLNRQQFAATVQETLFQVLEGQQVARANRLFTNKLGLERSADLIDQSRIIIHRNNLPGSERTRLFYSQQYDSSVTSVTSDHPPRRQIRLNVTREGVPVQADTLARRISKMVLRDWAVGDNLNLVKLKNAYRAELHRRGIDDEFQFDTLTIRPLRAEGNMMIFKSSVDNGASGGLVRTSPLPVNPMRNLFAQATFATPTNFLLRRMGWLLGSSLLLLLLTTGCFLFMLTTILRQKKLSDIKNDFINNMTHELKTPIATVTAAVEALQHFGALNDPAKTQTYLTISQNNLQRLSELVDKVLNLAVEEKRDLVLHPEPINLADLAGELVTNHKLRAAKPVDFAVDIPSDATVSVDRVHFSNALNNLIDNAIHYSRGQVAIGLTFRKKSDASWQLAVSDNGIGIPAMYQTAIFDRFFRVPTGDLHPVKGFGLGLAYVRQVVERHGGQIHVLSEPGKGSKFVIDC
ncbi:MAG TPA: HAMP domain-containing sensor histidine kinase [Fibrella sp.]